MRLRPGGLDIFYIDESHDSSLYVVTAIAVPFLRQVDGIWQITWLDHLAGAREWRRKIAKEVKIPASKELHASKLMSGRGNFNVGKRQFPRTETAQVYRTVLSLIDFLPPESIITATGSRGQKLYGAERLERVMYALFQRMRMQCIARKVNAMVFFDEGHPEYRSLYRRACVSLPTGSHFQSASRNEALEMFVKDGNMKDSKFCQFTQTADMIAYAALAKLRHERGDMSAEQQELGFHTLYDALPVPVRNLRASSAAPKDGIVRLG